MEMTEKEARRRAQVEANKTLWERRHASMLKVPASYFFDLLEDRLVNGTELYQDRDTFDTLEIIEHLRQRFPDDLTVVQVVESSTPTSWHPCAIDPVKNLHGRELKEEESM